MNVKLAVAALALMTGPGALATAQGAPAGPQAGQPSEVPAEPEQLMRPDNPDTAQPQAEPQAPLQHSRAPSPGPEDMPALVDARDPAAIVELMQAGGYPAELNVQESGAVEIRSQANGANFWLYFQACDPDFTNCEIITFAAGFDFSSPQVPELLGDWNVTRYSKAYLDKDGDPFVEFSVNMVHGVSTRNFLNTLNWFTLEMKAFMSQIGWNDTDVAAAQPI